MRGHHFLLMPMLFLTVLTSNLLQSQTSTNVVTWHNNNWRDGENNTETTLTQSNVKLNKGSSNQFGKICSTAAGAIDGQLYAQPLIATGTITGHNHVVYLATQNDSVYAIDGDISAASPSCKSPFATRPITSTRSSSPRLIAVLFNRPPVPAGGPSLRGHFY